MITAIAGGFGGVNGGGGESQAIFDAFNEALGAMGLGGNQGDDKPAAYLNYIFFDETYGFDVTNQEDNYGWQVVSHTPFTQTLTKFSQPIKITAPGYIYVYLSYENQSNNWVYFDDLKVNYQKSKVVQSNNYYAFGLQTSQSWTRIDTKPNQYLYNSGSELNELTGNYDLFFRGYDPALGRMSGVDIMASKYASHSPYNYGFNDPVFFSDPMGDDAGSSERGGYSWASLGGCGCWRDQGPQDYGGEARGMYGSSWNYYTYGSSTVGGSAFPRYGPGDGGALNAQVSFILAGSHEAKFRSQVLRLLESENGGYVSRGRIHYYQSQEETAVAAANYLTNTNGWVNTSLVAALRALGRERAMEIAKSQMIAGPFLPFLPPGSSYYGQLRHLTGPDAIAIGGNIDLVVADGFGVDITPLAVVLILKGPNAGEVVPILDAGVAMGLDFSASVQITNLYFTGSLGDFNSGSVTGFRVEANIAVSVYGFDFGGGMSFAPNLKADSFSGLFHNALVGESYSIGVSPAFPIMVSGNLNAGFTMKQSDATKLLNSILK